jgi:hypothetical protein
LFTVRASGPGSGVAVGVSEVVGVGLVGVGVIVGKGVLVGLVVAVGVNVDFNASAISVSSVTSGIVARKDGCASNGVWLGNVACVGVSLTSGVFPPEQAHRSKIKTRIQTRGFI